MNVLWQCRPHFFLSNMIATRPLIETYRQRWEGEARRARDTYPARGVADEVDEECWEFGPAHLGRRGRGNAHEALGAGFPHPPHVVWAELEKAWQLHRKRAQRREGKPKKKKNGQRRARGKRFKLEAQSNVLPQFTGRGQHNVWGLQRIQGSVMYHIFNTLKACNMWYRTSGSNV